MSAIEIVSSTETWREEFALIAKELSALLADHVLAIDHIGSTSVPDLPAKDVIDIQITVADMKDSKVKELLIAAGFDASQVNNQDNLVGMTADSPALKKWFFKQKPNTRRCHIHVREQGRVNQRYALLFRDFLRADSLTRNAYAAVKKELAQRFADDAVAYYAIKDPYMDTVYRAACLWAKKTNWLV